MSKWKKLLFLSITLVALGLGYVLYGNDARSSNDGVNQPIAFSHKIHAGENQIPCQYCHYDVAKGPSPAIPSIKACMGCHNYVGGTDREYNYNGRTINFKDEIGKLKGYWAKQEPIVWNKYHFVPDFARFKHRPHIRANLECATCHGDVKNVDLVVPVHKLEMGWCMSCHREKQKSESEMEALASDGKELVYLRDCATCHY